MKTIHVEFSDERLITPSGLVFVGQTFRNVTYTLPDGNDKTVGIRTIYEIKTDMDVERLPSGKFDSNKLVLELTVIAYNILRIIGQESLKKPNDN